MARSRTTKETIAQRLSKTAADTPRKPKVLNRDLKGTAPYKPDNIKYVVDMLTQLNTANITLAKAADTLGSISAHEISPDGLLGGRGYVMTIKDIRANITSAENLVSDLVDTLSDELTNPKWELTPEDVQRYKEQAKGGAPAVEAPLDTPAEEPAVPEFFGDEAPEAIPEGEVSPAEPSTLGDDLLPPPAEPEAPAAPEEPLPPLDMPAEDTPPAVAPPEVPYKKLASFVGHPERDPVSVALRSKILFNLLDGITAGH